MTTAIIILAAGASIRLGKPKQTLPYKDHSLLKHTIRVATEAGIGPVIVVIGANQSIIQSHLQDDPVTVIYNANYKEGIASSIHCGIIHLQAAHIDCNQIILMVCDQPLITTDILKTLVDTRRTTRYSIVACSYDGTIGVPALFDKQYFPDLLQLRGEEGGKKIIAQHPDSVGSIPFPAGSVDIDTAADYDTLLSGSHLPSD